MYKVKIKRTLSIVVDFVRVLKGQLKKIQIRITELPILPQ